MAPKSRANAAAGAKGKAGRRAPVKPKRGTGVPLLPIVVGSIMGVLTVALIGVIVYLQRPATPPQPVSGISCDQLEHSTSHYHAALQIIYHGVPTNITDNAGIQKNSAGTGIKCYYWLHVHANEKNVIHVEAPANDTFTLGQFFDVWNKWSGDNGLPGQKLDATHVSTFTVASDDKVVTYVDLGDGKGAQVYTGDPRGIVLKNQEVITIEITPPDVKPPPKFSFPSGL